MSRFVSHIGYPPNLLVHPAYHHFCLLKWAITGDFIHGKIPHFHRPIVLRHFVNSAYWTFTALDVARLEVRFCSVSARVDNAPEHNLGNLDAFNTDGPSDAARCLKTMVMWWKL